MDIHSGGRYPSGALSNFAPHPFVCEWRGFVLSSNSMEGFLQSLKFKSPEMQKHVATLVGRAAKNKGREKNWKRTQSLWWNGESIYRHSSDYQELLDVAFNALAQNESFRRALIATEGCVLTHTIGKSSVSDTILTQREFCSRLMKVRDVIQNTK